MGLDGGRSVPCLLAGDTDRNFVACGGEIELKPGMRHGAERREQKAELLHAVFPRCCV